MKIRNLMTEDVLTIGPDTPLKEAARRMVAAGLSGLAVTDDDGTLVGVITEADFVKSEAKKGEPRRAHLLRWFAHDEDFPSTDRKVKDVMTRDVVTIGPEADHVEAARLMTSEGIKRIPVIDASGRLIGIFGRADILKAFNRADADIISDIKDHLMRQVLWIDPKRVDVQSVDGNVVLTGRLETRGDASLLTDLARRVDGVVSVRDQLDWEVDNTKLEMVSPPQGFPRPNW